MKSNAHSVGCDIWKGGACSCGQPDRGPDIEETMSELEREIAWLREQLGLGEIGAKALADAKEEIARLRGLLREWLDEMTLLPSMRTKEQLLEDEETLLAEIERLRAYITEIEKWKADGERLIGRAREFGMHVPASTLFKLGNWWADRP